MVRFTASRYRSSAAGSCTGPAGSRTFTSACVSSFNPALGYGTDGQARQTTGKVVLKVAGSIAA